MPRITYGEDQKELKASNPQAIEYLLKQRLNKNNIVSDKLSNKVVQNKTKIVIVAPTITEFFKKSSN